MQEWRSVGIAAPKDAWKLVGASEGVWSDMRQLQQWAQTSAADLSLAEALLGQSLELEQSLGDVSPTLVAADVHGGPMLSWWVLHTCAPGVPVLVIQ